MPELHPWPLTCNFLDQPTIFMPPARYRGPARRTSQDHDPIPDALRLRCPHLAIFGGADELVPVADSIRLFSTAACHPGRHNHATLSVEVFPRASHRVQVSGGTRMAPGFLETLASWIQGRPDTSALPSSRHSTTAAI